MSTAVPQGMDERDFRAAIGCFVTGVAIVTTEDGGELHGMTVNSLTSVSLQPTLLLVCLSRPSRTETALQRRGEFVINVLAEDQGRVSDLFARRSEDHFSDPQHYSVNSGGLPVIKRAMSHFYCKTEQLYPGGDHTIVVGRVTRAEAEPRGPLVFFRGSYRALSEFQRDAALEWYW
jgi:flavin reductase (DIM6/NTAB) family NADH-FMN oxidoreductase RutF